MRAVRVPAPWSPLWALVVGLVAAAPLASSRAGAQFGVARHRPAPSAEDGIELPTARTLGPERWSLRLALDYARAPLVVGERGGGPERARIVDHQLLAHVLFAIGLLDRFEAHVALPLALHQSGDAGAEWPSPASFALQDGWIGGKARLLGRDEQGLQLAATTAFRLPFGSRDELSGDGGLGATAAVIPAFVMPDGWALLARVGVTYRPPRQLANARVGPELLMGAGTRLPVGAGLEVVAEVLGETALVGEGLFGRVSTRLEALAAVRWTSGSGLTVSGGGGPGLSQGVGTPAFRALASVGYVRPRPAPPEPMPDVPRPSADTDRDGLVDPSDRCPSEPEDADGHDDEDGCPDPDNDGDGIADGADRCVSRPEDRDGVDDADGCPDRDNDGDGFADGIDACPNEAETVNRYEDDDGCPDAVRIEQSELRLPAPIPFAVGRAELLPESAPTLEQILAILRDHPDIRVLSIEGHTSDEGTEAFNLRLSRQRARAVYEWLVERGVDRRRLRHEGFGLTRPLVANDSEENRRRNRRVEFRIVERTPASGGGGR